MKPVDVNSSISINQLMNDLQMMQHYLLMVKAAALAFCGKFNEYCPYTPARSPFSKEETAEYFVNQFLELDPDTKLEQAMEVIQSLSEQLELNKPTGSGKSNKPNEATIRISIDKD